MCSEVGGGLSYLRNPTAVFKTGVHPAYDVGILRKLTGDDAGFLLFVFLAYCGLLWLIWHDASDQAFDLGSG